MAIKQKMPETSARKQSAAGLLNTSPLDASLGYSLRRAELSAYADYWAAMEAYDIRPYQYAVLVLIRANPGVSQSLISEELRIQKTNFVAVIDRLEERGLTERRRTTGDRRASALFLTRTGETFVKKLEATHARYEKKLMSRLGMKRGKLLLQMLHDFSTPE
ncbi:MAG TPA: MarR family transcriptional regulator [Acidobacteriaceae bacterium]